MGRWVRSLSILLFAVIGVGLAVWGVVGLIKRTEPPPAAPVPEVLSSDPAVAVIEDAGPGEVGSLACAVLDGGRRVEGRFGAVRFEAWAVDAEDAQARYWIDGTEEAPLAVHIASEERGQLDWAGLAFDGHGPLPAERVAVLEALAGGPMAEALARIPLDLACRPEAAPVPAAVAAALLMPWQVLLKYAIERPTDAARAQALQAHCGYFGRRAPPGALGAPHPHLLMLSREQQIPMALPYLPLDGAGQRGSRP
jgi:hypothetical protein